MPMDKIKLKSGDEVDVFSKYRKLHNFKKGVVKKVKRGYNKRFRKESKKLLNED
jgi:predicted DNA-binding antitoxin AbrB/MazE fold protein